MRTLWVLWLVCACGGEITANDGGPDAPTSTLAECPIACTAEQYCQHQGGGGFCPPPDAGFCPPGCPGCPPFVDHPMCESLPVGCSGVPSCACLLAPCGGMGQ